MLPAFRLHFVYVFSRCFLHINWRNFIVWLPFLLEILGNMCMVTIYFPVCDVINSELTLAFLSSRFSTWPEKSGQIFEKIKKPFSSFLKNFLNKNSFLLRWELDFRVKNSINIDLTGLIDLALPSKLSNLFHSLCNTKKKMSVLEAFPLVRKFLEFFLICSSSYMKNQLIIFVSNAAYSEW